MLSIGRLGVTSGVEYYLDKVANNVDDYYLGRGEAPGHWIGATAEQLALVGQVDAASVSLVRERGGVVAIRHHVGTRCEGRFDHRGDVV